MMRAYEPRATKFIGHTRIGGLEFKSYAVLYRDEEICPKEQELLKTLTEKALGIHKWHNEDWKLGYTIIHKGRDSNYVVVCHWVQENMLRTQAFASTKTKPMDYSNVTASGINICVWDMQIHNFERDVFVKYILKNPENPDFKKYLNETYSN